jgi:MOSC domain-containing protein YiiM
LPSLPPQSTIARLLSGPVGPGTLVWIGLRPSRKAPVVTPTSATLIAHQGVEGDHYRTQRDGTRQVTLIAAEDLAAMASFLGRSDVPPELLRRNFVVRGMNLNALKGRKIWIGSAVLEITGECAPCSQMETNLGPGGADGADPFGGAKSGSVMLSCAKTQMPPTYQRRLHKFSADDPRRLSRDRPACAGTAGGSF